MLSALLLVAATSAPPKPLRHLEFSFHYTTISGGYNGKIYVDVLGAAQNDTLLLAIRQEVPLSHSLDAPPVQILVYPTGQVDVPPKAVPLRQPELNLARFLGRKFINGDYLDEKNHWRIDLTPPNKPKIATDFTITKNNAGILAITEAQKVVSATAGMQTNGRIAYDMNRTVPLSIHEQSVGTGSNAGQRFTYEYSLTADSLAPPKP